MSFGEKVVKITTWVINRTPSTVIGLKASIEMRNFELVHYSFYMYLIVIYM